MSALESRSEREPAPRHGGWRRRGVAVALSLGGLIALAALIAPFVFSQKPMRDAVVSQIQSLSGLYVAPGTLRLGLLPQPHLAMPGLSLADRNGALHITAENAFGALDPLALATGRIQLTAIQFVRPRVQLDADRSIDAPGDISRAAAEKLGTAGALEADRLLLGVASFVDGEVRVSTGGQTHVWERVNLTLDWRRMGEPLALTGNFIWRGEKFDALLSLARTGVLLHGGEILATARLTGDNVSLEAQGHAQNGINRLFVGKIKATAVSGRHALNLFGLPAKLPGPFANMQFTTEAAISDDHAQFDSLRLFADGNEFAGQATLHNDGDRLSLSAVMKSPFVSAKPLFADSPGGLGADGQWSREPFDGVDYPGVDLSLQLDAAHARLGRFALDDAAFLIKLRESALDVEISKARAYHGGLTLQAALGAAKTGLTLRANAQLQNVDAAALLRDGFGAPSIAGALDASVSFDASGADMSALMQNANGLATLALKDGRIDGLDLDRALRQLDHRPLSSALDIRAGRTILDKGTADVRIENGVAEIRDGAAHGPGIDLTFHGRADIAERTLSLTTKARATGGGAKDGEIAFDLGGGWDDIRLSTDAQSLIRRSDAAAPLLPVEPEARSDDAPR